MRIEICGSTLQTSPLAFHFLGFEYCGLAAVDPLLCCHLGDLPFSMILRGVGTLRTNNFSSKYRERDLRPINSR